MEVSERQVQILDMMGEGKSRRYIAKQLGVSEVTIAKDYRTVLRRFDDLKMEMGKLYFPEQLARLENLYDKAMEHVDKGSIEAITVARSILKDRDSLLDLSPRSGHGGGDTSFTIIYNGAAVDASELREIRQQRLLAPPPDPNVVEGEIVGEKNPIASWTQMSDSYGLFYSFKITN